MDTPDNRLAQWFIFYIAGLLFFTVGAITTLGLEWYRTLVVPSWTPSIPTIVVIWCVVFIFLALSAARVWVTASRATMGWYGANIILLLVWNYLFFGQHWIGLSLGAAVLVLLSVLALIFATWRRARLAAWLLVPYLAWMLFAIPLTHQIALLN